jgi:hypothetical protein
MRLLVIAPLLLSFCSLVSAKPKWWLIETTGKVFDKKGSKN